MDVGRIDHNRIVIVQSFIKHIKEVHIFLHGSSLVEKSVFGLAPATENAETIVAEFGIKTVVTAVFSDAEVNVFQFNRCKRIATLMQHDISIVLVIDNQSLITDFLFVLQIRYAADGTFFYRLTHAVKNAQGRIGVRVTHAGDKFRAFLITGGKRQQGQ